MSQAGVELGRAGAHAPRLSCRGGCGRPASARDPAAHDRPGPRGPLDMPVSATVGRRDHHDDHPSQKQRQTTCPLPQVRS